jgi:hypothetical protein
LAHSIGTETHSSTTKYSRKPGSFGIGTDTGNSSRRRSARSSGRSRNETKSSKEKDLGSKAYPIFLDLAGDVSHSILSLPLI